MHGNHFVSTADHNGNPVHGARLRKRAVLGPVGSCFTGESQEPGDGPAGAEGAPQKASEPTAPDAAQAYRPYAPNWPSAGRGGSMSGPAFIGLALVVIGVLALLDSLGFLAQVDLWRLWPLILIAFGAFLIIRRR